ncbi:hypothetical protein Leryth_027363 [Lithospermum erythrorhizon]|nr:hypothetical protein Leryth_027363 [Lithospermum erythrorhizon]
MQQDSRKPLQLLFKPPLPPPPASFTSKRRHSHSTMGYWIRSQALLAANLMEEIRCALREGHEFIKKTLRQFFQIKVLPFSLNDAT